MQGEGLARFMHGHVWEQLINERSFGSLARINTTWRALSHLPRVALWTLPSDFVFYFSTRVFGFLNGFFSGFFDILVSPGLS